jgi:nucleoside-diphosphate-sugar epimerase
MLVTGATGLIGSHLIDLLMERGERPSALVRPGTDVSGLVRRGVEIRPGDLRDKTSLERAVDGIDCVFHCAARAGSWGAGRDYVLDNVWGLATLIEAAVAAGVRRFVHVSSFVVHGNDVRGEADESAPLRVQADPCSRSKIAGEHIAARMIRDRGAPITVVRPGLVYGPRDRASFGRFTDLIAQRKMVLLGDGDNHLPLIYVRDVAQGILLAGTAPCAAGRTYLLVNDERVTQRQYLEAIAAELGVEKAFRRIPYGAAVGLGLIAETVGHLSRSQNPPPLTRFGIQLLGGENRFVIDRARRELGFDPKVDLAAGVREGVRWYRDAYPSDGDVAA